MSLLRFCNFSRLGYLLALILVFPLVACSGGDGGLSNSSSSPNSAKLSWVAPSEREDGKVLSLAEIAGFRVYYGTKSGVYPNTIDIYDHTATQTTLADLPSGTYFVALTVVDVDGRESIYSAEVVITV